MVWQKIRHPQEKTQMVLGVFDNVASRYDLMNDLMSLGIHRFWKDTLIRKIRPTPHLSYLDVAGEQEILLSVLPKKPEKMQNYHFRYQCIHA